MKLAYFYARKGRFGGIGGRGFFQLYNRHVSTYRAPGYTKGSDRLRLVEPIWYRCGFRPAYDSRCVRSPLLCACAARRTAELFSPGREVAPGRRLFSPFGRPGTAARNGRSSSNTLAAVILAAPHPCFGGRRSSRLRAGGLFAPFF